MLQKLTVIHQVNKFQNILSNPKYYYCFHKTYAINKSSLNNAQRTEEQQVRLSRNLSEL